MSMLRSRGRARTELRRPLESEPKRDALSQIRLLVQTDLIFPPVVLLESDEWGYLLPAEAPEALGMSFVQMDTPTIPAGAIFFVYFEAEGDVRHEVKHEYTEPGPVLTLRLPAEWMSAAVGKQVALDYEVEWPDGTRIPGPGMSFRIHPYLEIPPVRINGFNFGEPVPVDALPDLVIAMVDPIRNVESFHNVRIRMMLDGEKDGWIESIFDFSYTLLHGGQEAENVGFSRWYFENAVENGYTNLKFYMATEMQMAPPPNLSDDWVDYVRIGGHPILPS